MEFSKHQITENFPKAINQIEAYLEMLKTAFISLHGDKPIQANYSQFDISHSAFDTF